MEGYRAELTAAVLGIAAQVYLSPIPEVPTIKVLQGYIFQNVVLLACLFNSSSSTPSISAILLQFWAFNTIFLLTTFTLTAIRRLFFSPLTKFPGPKLAALSKIWAANEFRLGRHSLTVKDLHKKYDSDIVRIGPNEVSIRNVDAVEKIYRGRYTRGTFYEVGVLNGEFNLNTRRDYRFHPVWRRIWEKAFLSSEFKDYNPRVEHHVSKLVKRMGNMEGKEVNVSGFMDDFVFDVMADLSFAKGAGMQDGMGDGSYMGFIHKFMAAVGVVGSLRNLCQLLVYLPETAELKEYRLKGERMLAERQKLGTTRKDIFRHLLAEDSETGSKFTQAQLNSNANLIIVAGSDTTSSTLSQTFGVLAKDQRILKKLQEEIDSVREKGEELTVETTKNLVYLNGVVNEALRLLNPIPSGVQATTPTIGVEVADVHLPGSIQVQVPHIVLMTDERYFPNPEEFIPERWTGEKPQLLLEKRAFIPFGYGVHSCVGKQLALNEMRLVLARVVRKFDVVRGESYDEERFREEWMDYAVLHIGAMWVKFVLRG